MKIKTISNTLLCSALLLTTQAFAQAPEVAPSLKGSTIAPHSTHIISGNWFNSRVLHCSVRAQQLYDNPITIRALHKRVIFNGQILTEKETMPLLVSVGAKLNFELDARGKLEITNDGASLINIHCD